MTLNKLLAAASAILLMLTTASGFHPAMAQSGRSVSGVITSADDGEPLVGAFVLIKGTKTGTTTDMDGNFVLNLPESGKSYTLVVQYLGMAELETSAKAGQKLNLSMKSDNTLDEVIIQAGYGLAQKRSDMTGSAFQVESKQLAQLPAARIDNILEGIVPGVTIDTREASIGARPKYNIRVRGDASLNANSEPLWIIDGVPIYTGNENGQYVGTSYDVSPLSFINPDDIESMTVLKDAATTSIYGADGANGVILVTTKSGNNSGKTSVNASVKYGMSQVDRSTLPKFCNAEQWLSLAKEGWVNAGYSLENFPYRDNPYNSYSTTDTNWQDVYLGTGNVSQYNLSVSSGNTAAKEYLSLSYYNEKSPVKGNLQQRLSVRSRTNYTFNSKFSADVNLSLSYNANKIFSISSSALHLPPIFSPYDEDGYTPRLYNYYSTDVNNYKEEKRKFVYNYVPVRDLADNRQRTLNAEGSALLKYEIIDGLSLTSQIGANSLSTFEMLYYPETTLDGIYDSDNGGQTRRSGVFSYVWNNIDRLNYNKKFGKHNVGVLAAIELVSKEHRSLYATGHGFANDHIQEVGYAEDESRRGSSTASNNRSLSYLGQATYSYDNRYYLSASYRRQGYSSFSKYAQWGDFTSVGLSWNVNNEPWYNIGFINKMKIKASYGNSGNSRVDTSSAYGTYTYSSGSYYGGIMGATQGAAPNPGLSWETTHIMNLGIDLSLFDSRVELEVEGYDKLTTDLLYKGKVSSIITDGSVIRNVGEMENYGLEVTLSTVNIDNADFRWTTDFNGSFNRNIIHKLYEGMHTGFFDTVWIEGATKDAWWLSRWAGVDPSNGAPMWYDVNGNLTYQFTYDNRVLLPEYSKEPKLRGGLNNTFQWGPFSARIMLTYTLGGWTMLSSLTDDGYDIISWNVPVEELEHWTKPGDISANPKYVYKNSTHSATSSTRFLHSTTNVSVKNASVSYSLPKDICKTLKLSGATVSIIGDNLYLWSPEQSRTKNSYKTLNNVTGITRSISAQISINF